MNRIEQLYEALTILEALGRIDEAAVRWAIIQNEMNGG